jgi:hypothetical protein
MRSASALHHSRQLAIELVVSELCLREAEEFGRNDIANVLSYCPGSDSRRSGVFLFDVGEGAHSGDICVEVSAGECPNSPAFFAVDAARVLLGAEFGNAHIQPSSRLRLVIDNLLAWAGGFKPRDAFAQLVNFLLIHEFAPLRALRRIGAFNSQ